MIRVIYNKEYDELCFCPEDSGPKSYLSIRKVRARLTQALGEINVDGCWQFSGHDVVVGTRAWLGSNREP